MFLSLTETTCSDGLWRTASVEDGLHSCPETIDDFASSKKENLLKHGTTSEQKGASNYNTQTQITNGKSFKQCFSSTQNLNNLTRSVKEETDKKNSFKFTEGKPYSGYCSKKDASVYAASNHSDGQNNQDSSMTRCTSIDNFYTPVRRSDTIASVDRNTHQSMNYCFNDSKSNGSGSHNNIVQNSLYSSRRWQSEAMDVNKANDSFELELPSVKNLASKFDSLRHQTTEINYNSLRNTRTKHVNSYRAEDMIIERNKVSCDMLN